MRVRARENPNQLVLPFCDDPARLADGIDFIEGHCTRSRKGRTFYIIAERIDVATNHVLARINDFELPNVVHVLLGQSVRPDRAPTKLRVAAGNALWLNTGRWPSCPYCRARTLYCTGCSHILCAMHIHEVSGWTYDPERHRVEFCHLCP